jgi:hypothetical protein
MADIVNAVIKSAHLGYEGHGILTAMVTFEWGDHAQSFPQYNLNGTMCAPFIKGMLGAVGVDFWGQLVGKYVRLEVQDGWKPQRVGHIVHDVWFSPQECSEECLKQEATVG